ncbi:MAG: cell division protein FtsX [Campylobacterota bacterium]|nr:cell division protein FtsX [Campylobacterota bacterium]
MKPLKSFISFTFPLIVMLFIFSIYLLVNKVVYSYKSGIINDYAIVVITNTPFISIEEIADIKVKNIEPLSRTKIIEGVKDNLSDSSLNLLNKKLPYFYKIYLEEFPTTLKLEQIRKELNTISNIRRIETFSSDHNKIYSLLILIQNIVLVLFVAVMVLSVLLLSKQIKIWFFEHNERISIILLHGGSLFYSAKPILRIIIFSSIVSGAVVIGLLYLIVNNLHNIIQPEILSLMPEIIDLELEIMQVVILSFVIPLITFFGLLVQHKSR